MNRHFTLIHLWPGPSVVDYARQHPVRGFAYFYGRLTCARPIYREKTNAVNGREGLGSSSVVSVPWPQIDEAAFQGLAGEAVKAIEPHSEADPVALLMQFLTMAGNLIGRLLEAKKPPGEIINEVYVRCLCRKATAKERTRLDALLAEQPDKKKALEDIFWAVLNTREFMFNH